MTTVFVKDGFRYTISGQDYLWLGRAASGEGGNPAATIWAWLQRFAGLPGIRQRYGSLTELVRAHSQPVNPRWMRDGEFCRPGGSKETSGDCAPTLLARRDRIANLAPSDFPIAVQAAVAALRAGILPNPVPKAVDFATCERVDREIAGGQYGFQIVSRTGGCFVSTAASRAWPNDYVTLGPSGVDVLGISIVGASALAVAAGVAVWAWWVHRPPRPGQGWRSRSRRR